MIFLQAMKRGCWLKANNKGKMRQNQEKMIYVFLKSNC